MVFKGLSIHIAKFLSQSRTGGGLIRETKIPVQEPGVTGQNLPLKIFSWGENILRINSPPRVNFLGKYLPL